MDYYYGPFPSFSTFHADFRTGCSILIFLLLSNLGWGQCFKPPINTNATSLNVVAGDFNGDGKPDLATVQHYYNQNNYAPGDSIAIFLNQGGGLFVKGKSSFVGAADSLSVGDINTDGKLDVVVVNGNESVAVLLGDGKGKLGAPLIRTISGYGYPAVGVLISDFNGDTYPDLAVTGLYDSVTVLLNDGHAGFGRGVKYSAGKSSQIRQTRVGDFNGDGKADLIFLQDYYQDYFVSLLLNNGMGGFNKPIIIRDHIFSRASAAETGDFNSDGKPDFVVAGDSIAILLNTGIGGFSINKIANPNRGPNYNYYIVTGDFNSDGKADLALPGYVLSGKGNGFFASPTTFIFPKGNPYGGFLTGDFDTDGQPDLLAQLSNTVSLFLNCVNTPPQPTSNSSQTATVGMPFAYTANAFTDTETPNSLTYSASLTPANGLSFEPATRLISGTPSMSGITAVTITAIDPTGLSAATSFTITVKPPLVLGVEEPAIGQLTLSPNPVTDIVMITLTSAYKGTVSVQIISAGGQPVRTYTSVKTATTWQHTLSVQGLPAGSYYLSLQQNGKQIIGKLLKL